MATTTAPTEPQNPRRTPVGDDVVDEEFTEDPNQRIHPSAPSVVPELFKTWPPIVDRLETHTSELQRRTVEKVLPYLDGTLLEASGVAHNDDGVPSINRQLHANFLRRTLTERLPKGFIAADASRPWFLYWCLSGLVLLGEDVSEFRGRLVETARSMQSPGGGFGGGDGQTAHLATTYALVLALTIVGGEEAYEVVDRKAMWRWLGLLKQPDGGFTMAYGGEEDVR
jgi:protein farnesyltransferase subunit beta